MTRSILFSSIAASSFLLSGCSTLSSKSGLDSEASSKMIAPSPTSETLALDLKPLHERIGSANEKIKAVFPSGRKDKITLWAIDLENLVDGTFTQSFGQNVSPSPSLKLYRVFKNSGVTIMDQLHVPPCTEVGDSSRQAWVLRTYVSNLDETIQRSVRGFYPNGESGDFQAEIDRGTRSMTDSFKLSAKLTDCRSGKIIHSAESEFLKTSSSKDKSVYLFGKHLGLFYRSTEYEDPGLNRTKDMALDVFLTSIAMEMVGATTTN